MSLDFYLILSALLITVIGASLYFTKVKKGTVQWIDQSEDVRLRASEDKLEAALVKAFYTVT